MDNKKYLENVEIKQLENGENAYICSELVAKILFEIDKPMDMITPRDIQRYLKNMEL